MNSNANSNQYLSASARRAIARTFRASSATEVVTESDALLSLLGDPFTRVVRGDEERRFDMQVRRNEGGVLGAGCQGSHAVMAGAAPAPTPPSLPRSGRGRCCRAE